MEVKSACDAEKRRLVLMNIVRFDQELFQIDYINFSTGSIKTKGRKPGKKAYSNSVNYFYNYVKIVNRMRLTDSILCQTCKC